MSSTSSEHGSVSGTRGFLCLVAQKSVEFNVTDHKLHRASKDKELQEELQSLYEGNAVECQFQSGGGCCIFTDSPSPVYIGKIADAVAVFEGNLSNYEDLNIAWPVQASGEDQSVPTKNPASLICGMYAAVGLEMLGMLRGSFCFCLYEAKTGRVLAARDGSGKVPLFQGMTSAESLVISTNVEFLSCCHDVKKFERGAFKYGFYSEPRLFSSRQGQADKGRMSARHSMDSGQRRSIDNGSNWLQQKTQRPQAQRTSMDNNHHRGSMDLTHASPQQREEQHQASSWRHTAGDTKLNESDEWHVVSGRRRGSLDVAKIHHPSVPSKGEKRISTSRAPGPACGGGRKSVDAGSPGCKWGAASPDFRTKNNTKGVTPLDCARTVGSAVTVMSGPIC